EDRFSGAARRVQRKLVRLPADAKFSPLKSQVAALVALADFSTRAEATDEGAHNARLQKIFRIHEQLTGVLITLVDDLNFELVVQSEEAVKRSSRLTKELVAKQITELRHALEIAA